MVFPVYVHLLSDLPDTKLKWFCHVCWVLTATVWCLLVSFPLKLLLRSDCYWKSTEKKKQIKPYKRCIKEAITPSGGLNGGNKKVEHRTKENDFARKMINNKTKV